MARKYDFVIDNWGDDYKTIMRWYPSTTHVHSFNDNPPDTWEKVYKVYYSWSILTHFYNDKGEIIPEYTKKMFEMSCDECSRFPELANIIREIMKTGKEFNYPTLGQPAADWHIWKETGIRAWKNNEPFEYYHFEVFDNFYNNGFQFTLTKEETENFCDWLDKINEIALKNGEPI